MRRKVLNLLALVCLAFSVVAGCSEQKTEIPKEMKEIPKLTPAGSGGGGKQKQQGGTNSAN